RASGRAASDLPDHPGAARGGGAVGRVVPCVLAPQPAQPQAPRRRRPVMTAATDTALGVVRAGMEVAASPEKVFRALTDPHDLEQWWGSADVYQTFGWVSDLRPGGERSCQARSPGHQELSTVKGEYLVIQPPKLLEFTWLASWEPGLPPTKVRIELDPVPAGT